MKGPKCMLCGRDSVPVKNGRVLSHLGPGGVKCHAAGMPAARMEAHRKLVEQIREVKK